jgi:hypothetical protein
MVKAARALPSTLTEIDLVTGEETHKPMAWKVMPPPAGSCQICGVKHEPSEPHNAQSLYYDVTFSGMVGRSPTWADAMAHCAEPVRQAWERELRRAGHWSEPPDGERPVKHHGVEHRPSDHPPLHPRLPQARGQDRVRDQACCFYGRPHRCR